MKTAILLVLFFLFNSSTGWLTDFGEAQKIALAKHQNILLNFSGSDWCGPCIRLKKDVFETDAFKDFSSNSLVLLRADFPRNKKNKLTNEQLKHNEALAEKYNADGKFPYTILLDPQGKLLKAWDGIPAGSVETFIKEIKLVCDNNK